MQFLLLRVYTITSWTPRALIFTRHFDIAYLVGVFWDYIVSWLFGFFVLICFVFESCFIVSDSSRTLCFESRPYCLIILHDVLSFHLVILLFSWVCVYVFFLLLSLFRIMHLMCYLV